MDQPNKFDPFKQFDQAKVSLLEAKVARLTAEQRDIVDAQDLSNEATMRGAVSRHTIIRGGSFPWGSQWCWGFSFLAGEFRIHNPFVKIGPRILEFSAPSISVGEGDWGVVCDVDWVKITPSYEFKTVTSQADMTEVLENEADGSTSAERMPVAWFNKSTLLLDYIHGMPYPHVLSGYYS